MAPVTGWLSDAPDCGEIETVVWTGGARMIWDAFPTRESDGCIRFPLTDPDASAHHSPAPTRPAETGMFRGPAC